VLTNKNSLIEQIHFSPCIDWNSVNLHGISENLTDSNLEWCVSPRTSRNAFLRMDLRLFSLLRFLWVLLVTLFFRLFLTFSPLKHHLQSGFLFPVLWLCGAAGGRSPSRPYTPVEKSFLVESKISFKEAGAWHHWQTTSVLDKLLRHFTRGRHAAATCQNLARVGARPRCQIGRFSSNN